MAYVSLKDVESWVNAQPVRMFLPKPTNHKGYLLTPKSCEFKTNARQQDVLLLKSPLFGDPLVIRLEEIVDISYDNVVLVITCGIVRGNEVKYKRSYRFSRV